MSVVTIERKERLRELPHSPDPDGDKPRTAGLNFYEHGSIPGQADCAGHMSVSVFTEIGAIQSVPFYTCFRVEIMFPWRKKRGLRLSGKGSMARFEMVIPLLKQGDSIRRGEWDPTIRMFVSSGSLMCQCGLTLPRRYSLSWDEITATDWEVVHTATASAIATLIHSLELRHRESNTASTFDIEKKLA